AEMDEELFINIHPLEMRGLDELALLLADVREQFPDLKFTAEIHESLVTNPAAMLDFRNRLVESSIKIAYDDFGAGQARLMELAEAPPDYLKFDRCLLEKIHLAPRQRPPIVETLVHYA